MLAVAPKPSAKPRRLRNVIVQYKGGGYEGCFWEWNYAYFGPGGTFHNICSSGYKGCDTRQKLVEYLDSADASGPHSPHSSVGYDIYSLGSRKERERLGRETPIHHLLGLAKWFAGEDLPFDVVVSCDCCHTKVEVLKMAGEGCHGVGGIASEYDKIICEDCLAAYSCSYCGEYYGPDYKGFNPETGYCESCTERETRRLKQQRRRKGGGK